ncbi:ribonuclease R [Mucisphaera calidilacus]|uniref:Ribonuclease R n=1 Tax=Mucisphaera calidilacus TaxID=2527982 RepID=A0A518C0S0_9BACT|nr:ribonuclease R [Mucisphaera calidilacus]QDU72800.1 Ribonuclease R [Mucisphaera calidilacus]
MSERIRAAIVRHLSDRRYRPSSLSQLAKQLNIDPEDQQDFEQAVKHLIKDKQLVLGSADTLALPPPGREVTGRFSLHPRGFGFITPDDARTHTDLFVPAQNTAGAMTGDTVRARVLRDRHGGSEAGYIGRIIEILKRTDKTFTGTIFERGRQSFVRPDGKALTADVLIRDAQAANARPGDKVAFEIIAFPESPDERAEGVITRILGESGVPEVETQAIIQAYDLPTEFPEPVLEDARKAVHKLEAEEKNLDRRDLTDTLILTIDPPDARDFDDAISLTTVDDNSPAVLELGVHIADVALYIEPGSAIDEEAKARGNSVYLPRHVIPMLPEVLSNGVCSLQENVPRCCLSCFIRYDADANVVSTRFDRTRIHSAKRFTYLEAQAVIDGDIREAIKHAKTEAKYPRPVIKALKAMNDLARKIRQRRLRNGMIVLGLPEVELVYDDAGHVIDAQPEDDAFTHKLIEMFMVEANEAAASLFDRLDIPMIRRVHPDPPAHDMSDLRGFARVAGYNIPAHPTRQELQGLLQSVEGKPAQTAVHLAVLKTLSKAEYSPAIIGHFALASEHYSHFTSPIRRYPDLILHRALAHYIEAERQHGRPLKRKDKATRKLADLIPSEEQLTELGGHCSATERNAEAAERELRNFLVLQLLADHMGDDFPGTVTGVTNRGIFVQIDRFLVDGFVELSELPGPPSERWSLNRQTGALVAQRSGKTITIGDRFTVRIANVDLARRQLELAVVSAGGKPAKPSGKKTRKQAPGAKKALAKTARFKRARNKTSRKPRRGR